jgi:hypothetical protein
MPALRQAEMVSTERDLGPSVPTIFVIAGKKLVLDGSRIEAIRMGSSSRRFVECILARC